MELSQKNLKKASCLRTMFLVLFCCVWLLVFLKSLSSDFQVVDLVFILLKFFPLFFPISLSTDLYQEYFHRTGALILKIVS